MQVQIFGTKKSSETRAALRFFAERRIQTHFVDLTERAASPRELERFINKFGLAAIIDREGKKFKELGLAHAQLSPQRWVDKLVAEPMLLRMPLVRYEHRVTVGEAQTEWKTWS